eukprot:NODE_18413_length_894_cov_5.747066.p1 GENE.NODE_18413_length_894_cov_5.747066~~NODE_18413_length_894_cov_5.747066.p1  ORF type:complete len:126 (-),score=9.10 NODE_18413_length_894_cov_5.747066:17-394(-)
MEAASARFLKVGLAMQLRFLRFVPVVGGCRRYASCPRGGQGQYALGWCLRALSSSFWRRHTEDNARIEAARLCSLRLAPVFRARQHGGAARACGRNGMLAAWLFNVLSPSPGLAELFFHYVRKDV